MIARYTRPVLGEIWSEANKYRCWLEVELAAAEALAEGGEVPSEAARALRQYARFDLDRIAAIERETRHDVIAFTTAVAEAMAEAGAGEASRWLHYGLTSNDVVDTAQALQVKAASGQIALELDRVAGAIERQAFAHRYTVQIGRTHGIHAEPITFGLKLALWWDEVQRHRQRFADASEEMRVGKLSGAVGTFAHISPENEVRICERLGLKAAPISSQVISRDRHAHYVAVLGGIASSLDKFALEIRHLQRTEVREAEEPFAPGQKGSSAMPHKRNPVTCEQICGLARVVRSNAQAAFENVPLWHERDISHSSVERVILPDSTTLTDYLLAKTTWLIEGLRVNTSRMRQNVDLTRGLIFSGQLLLDLAAAGLSREDAYRIIQSRAMDAWENDADFRAAVASDPVVQKYLSPEALERSFSFDRQLAHVDTIFQRVFGR